MTAAVVDLLSPELALVDHDLAVRARGALAEPEDTLERITLRRPFEHDPVAGKDAVAAYRRLAASNLASPEFEPRERRIGRRLTVVAFASSVAALAVGMAFLGQPSREIAAMPRALTEEAHAAPIVPAADGPLPAAKTEAASLHSGATQASKASSHRPRGVTARARAHAASTTTRRRIATTRLRAAAKATAAHPLPRQLRWTAVPGATGYSIELFRGTSRILSTRSTSNHATILGVWGANGSAQRLDPDDRLYVWPLIAGKRASTPVLDGVLVVDVP